MLFLEATWFLPSRDGFYSRLFCRKTEINCTSRKCTMPLIDVDDYRCSFKQPINIDD